MQKSNRCGSNKNCFYHNLQSAFDHLIIGFGRAVSRILSALLRRRESFVWAADTRNPSAFAERGAGRSGIPYLALHPMGFSVPRRLRFARCALTAPFHPCRHTCESTGGLIFCGTVRRKAFQLSARVYPNRNRLGVTRHRALWCSDFPLPARVHLPQYCYGGRAESDSPPFQNQWKNKRSW